jgi:hypothetical protein
MSVLLGPASMVLLVLTCHRAIDASALRATPAFSARMRYQTVWKALVPTEPCVRICLAPGSLNVSVEKGTRVITAM